jgi:drug/metabolite transporter (DMT)-like permease
VRALATVVFTAGALGCFAANSLLARTALGRGLADPATFTAVRLLSGAVALGAIVAASGRGRPRGGGWRAALALFGYAVAFSLAYLRIHAGVGALILFGAVQATMIGWAVAGGRRPRAAQWAGVALALGGLGWLTLPGADAPDLMGAGLMALAGVAWGAYSLAGRGAGDPVATTADNFLRSAPFAAGLLLLGARDLHASGAGVALAVASGAVASGGGYSLWYAVLPALGPTRAASVQLSVPVLTAGAAVVLLGEPVTARLALSAVAILAGIALTLRGREGSVR